jgi:hypothetical protein
LAITYDNLFPHIDDIVVDGAIAEIVMRTYEVSGHGQALARQERLRKVASGKSIEWMEMALLIHELMNSNEPA